MTLLRDNNRYKWYATLSADGKGLCWLSVDDDPTLLSRSWDGKVDNIEGNEVYFYRDKGEIYFGFNDKQYLIDDQVTASREPLQNDKIRFRLFRGQCQIFEWIYQRIKLPIMWDIPNLPDEEDFDIGQWAFNVINSPERRAIFRDPFGSGL